MRTSRCDSTPCVDTGILATKWIMELLSLRGRTDVGLDLAFKTDFPSWGYMAAMNATTVWEHWEYMNGTYNHGKTTPRPSASRCLVFETFSLHVPRSHIQRTCARGSEIEFSAADASLRAHMGRTPR